MAIIISDADIDVGKIGYDNLLETATLTASTEATGYEKENIADGLGYDFWKPTATGASWVRGAFGSAQVFNYFAVWGHDLADHGSSVKLQYSTDSGSTWSDATSYSAPSTNRALFFSFDDISAADVRVVVNNPSTIAAIGGAMVGESLDLPYGMPVGFSPGALTPEIETRTSESENGAFIGGSQIRKGIKNNLTLEYLDPTWVRDTLKPFIDHAQTPKVFVFSWDNENHNDEAVLAWLKPNTQPSLTYSQSLYMTFSMQYEGTL